MVGNQNKPLENWQECQQDSMILIAWLIRSSVMLLTKLIWENSVWQAHAWDQVTVSLLDMHTQFSEQPRSITMEKILLWFNWETHGVKRPTLVHGMTMMQDGLQSSPNRLDLRKLMTESSIFQLKISRDLSFKSLFWCTATGTLACWRFTAETKECYSASHHKKRAEKLSLPSIRLIRESSPQDAIQAKNSTISIFWTRTTASLSKKL